MICEFWIGRHGRRLVGTDGKKLDEMTPEGFEQVSNSVERHLGNKPIDLALHSGTRRTEHSLQVALNRLGLQPREIGTNARIGPVVRVGCEPRLRYTDELIYDFGNFSAIERELIAKHGVENVTARHWLESDWKPAWAGRAQMTAFLNDFARNQWRINNARIIGTRKNHWRILCYSHSPLAELAAPNPARMTALRTGDFAHYLVEVTRRGSVILKATYHPCPTHI